MYKVSIIEDSKEIAQNLINIISDSEDFIFTGLWHSGESGFENIKGNNPDLLILDIGLPDISGIDLIVPIRKKIPDIKIIIFTIFEDEESIIKAIQNGANGYVLKETPKELFLAELKVLMLGGASLTPRIATKISDLYKRKERAKLNSKSSFEEPLTDRQNEILNLIVLGFSYKEISDELNISPHTVRRHIENIYQKLRVNKKTEAIRKYHQSIES
ncbi:MAG: response regulator transcription factor [Leptospiraceae bacterium]|nr:response regulator transcription factor [Leptospiraceae bacterium]MCK6381161.1 response regulator transcription factor [Leptospiraceae bacterium]NUM41994.1 response regulator transcription factor [Leptospiraceae bacterium]